MKVKCHQISSAGTVRDHNEDFLLFWEPEEFELAQKLGSLALLADGVGGEGNGDIASRLAVETALAAFKESSPEATPAAVARQMFDAASAKVFQAAQDKGRMATTLLASIYRHDKATIAHVGDSRAYLIRGGKIKRLTTDHSYTALQVKLGLLLERNAMTGPNRSTLTRSIGYEPMCHYDISTLDLLQGDIILQCSDGLYGFILDEEILEAAVKYHPGEACKRLIALAEKRQVSDNVSVQIIQVWDLDLAQPSDPAASRSAGSSGHELSVGNLLDERFEITDVIAKSGMASLFKANDRQTGQAVALKVPFLQIESDPAGFDRFRREEEIGLQLDHPYILKVIRVEKKSRPYLVMEYLEGQTLGELLKSVRPLPEPDAVKIASRICEALDYMHKGGVIHRDLKPQNIMLCNDGTIRIMDFGIAKALASRRLTFVGFTPAMGTPDYMAPEQIEGQRGDQRTDIYALGTILYEMLAGRTPFSGDTAMAVMAQHLRKDATRLDHVNSAITPELAAIVSGCLARDPNKRYSDMLAFINGLDHPETANLGILDKLDSRSSRSSIWQSQAFRGIAIALAILAGFTILALILQGLHK